MIWAVMVYNCLGVLVTTLFVIVIKRTDTKLRIIRSFLLMIIQFSILFLGAIIYPVDGFGRIRLLAWGSFFQLPLFLIGLYFIHRNTFRHFSKLMIILSLLIALTALDAFIIEPHWLEVTHISLTSSKLDRPLVIAVLADIQTDRPGSYEAKIFRLTREQNPDLVFLAGDYLQIGDLEEYRKQSENFKQIFRDANLDPPLGIYAVKGNVDRDDWLGLFGESEVIGFESTDTLDLGPLELTGISWRESIDSRLSISRTESYHIVLGHSPDFSLGDIEADLLVAGHTHGGQFQLPGIGPILTLSAVPRNWATGLTEIHPDQYLLVSRGIGMERGNSPRMRFLCRPEIIFLHLNPANNGQ